MFNQFRSLCCNLTAEGGPLSLKSHLGIPAAYFSQVSANFHPGFESPLHRSLLFSSSLAAGSQWGNEKQLLDGGDVPHDAVDALEPGDALVADMREV